MLRARDVPKELRRVCEGFRRPEPGLRRDFAELMKESDHNWLSNRDSQLGKALCSTYT
jgi:hypothetical protein